jgi:hypothetical protein
MTSKIALGIAVAGLSLALASSPAGAAPKPCDEAAVAAASAAVAAACPCDGKTAPDGSLVPWKNHGQYVRCVSQETTKQIRTSGGTLTRRCMRTSVRCGARSTCGKPGSVACRIHDDCIGDAAPGDGTQAGTCEHDITVACDTSADCAVRRCSVKRSALVCDAAGGASSSGSCCD